METSPVPETPNSPQKSSVRIKPKIGKNLITCGSISAVFVLLFCSAIAIAVAKTGVITIPFFSRFYNGPKPTRLINAQPISVDAFRVLLTSRFTSQALEGKKPPYEVKVTEKELTSVMETAIDLGLRDQAWKQVFTQIVIRPSGFEFLTQFQRGIWHIDMLARFKPVVHEGGLSFEPTEIRIGDYPMPASAAYKAVSYLFSRDLGTFFLNFADTPLQDVRLEEGSMTVVAHTQKAASAPKP